MDTEAEHDRRSPETSDSPTHLVRAPMITRTMTLPPNQSFVSRRSLCPDFAHEVGEGPDGWGKLPPTWKYQQKRDGWQGPVGQNVHETFGFELRLAWIA